MNFDYIKVKFKNKLIRIKTIIKSLFSSVPIVLLTSIALMFFFDFFIKTGVGILQLIECIAIYFITNEIKPILEDTVFFK